MKKKFLLIFTAILSICVFAFTLFACGNEPVGALEYEPYDYGTEYQVVGLGTVKSKTVSVPDTYKGKPVTRIAEGAFSESNIEKVVLPEGIEEIADSAFSDCPLLTNVVIPQSVYTVAANAFSGSVNLNYTVSNQLKYLGNGENPYLLLTGATVNSLTELSVNGQTKLILAGAFMDFDFLKSVNISDGVERIQVVACHAKGQPVLVGTVSIDKSELLSLRLKKAGIPHTVLNAKYHEKEAEIVAQAGKLGAVTISTNMAGRGTDILLGGNPEFMAKADMRAMGIPEEAIAACAGFTDTEDEEILSARKTFRELVEKYREQIAPEAQKVREAGGLFILGTERHESRRIDNQLRGRSGRQGDPGESRFFLSMEDDLMRLFGADRIQGIVAALKLPEDMPIDARILSGAIENAQKRIEDNNFRRRKYVLAYDDVMNQQRTIIYKQRQDVLNGEDISETIQKMIHTTVEGVVYSYLHGESAEDWDYDGLRAHYLGLLTSEEDFRFADEKERKRMDPETVSEILCERAMQVYAGKEELFGSETFREVERAVLLRHVDSAWMEHIDTMDELKSTVGLQSYAQRDPVTEYRLQGAEMFDAMVEEIRNGTVRAILTVMPRPQVTERVQVANPTTAGLAGEGGKRKIVVRRAGTTVVKDSASVGRNDPCPCGSGKKYKNCCLRTQGAKD